MKRILVAGIGNIFMGDDAFGVEVARELTRHWLPPEVCVADFGIRSYDLAYALADGFDIAILVDAAPHGEAPGTIYLIEPELAGPSRETNTPVDAHSLDPVLVLQTAELLGGLPRRVLLVGCEPGEPCSEDGRMGLSAPVLAAVPAAISMIESLVRDLLDFEIEDKSGFGPARKETQSI